MMEFIHTVVCSLYASGCFSIIYMCSYPTQVINVVAELYETHIQPYVVSGGIRAITAYSSAKNDIYGLTNDIYMYHPGMTYTIDFITFILRTIYAELYNFSIEPFSLTWVSKCILLNCDTDSNTDWKLTSMYYCIDTNAICPEWVNFTKSFNAMSSNISCAMPNYMYDETLLFGRFNGIYVSRIQHSKTTELTKYEEFTQPSCVSFLSVSLSIPDQKPVDIIVEKNLLYVNNELLSKAFIKRYLDHSNDNVIFNDNYTVDIIDSNVDMLTLKSGEYIVLHESDCTVCKEIANTD